jgi:hypothetical protein
MIIAKTVNIIKTIILLFDFGASQTSGVKYSITVSLQAI